jgi:hypothetical protein
MLSHAKAMTTIARYVVLSIAMAVLASAWGCGGSVPSQITLDEAGQKRVQDTKDLMRKSMEKRQQVEAKESKKARRR